MAASADFFKRIFKARHLEPGKLIFIRLVGRREVRHHAVKLQVGEPVGAVEKARQLRVRHAEPSHARINFQMVSRRAARPPRRRVKAFEQIEPIQHRRQLRRQQRLFLAFPESAEAEYGARDACLSERLTFFGQGDAEPVCAFAFERQGASDRAVAVSVGLDRRHHANRGADSLFNQAKIVSQVIEVDFGPGRAARRQS